MALYVNGYNFLSLSRVVMDDMDLYSSSIHNLRECFPGKQISDVFMFS
jgi:hypothetical protein